MVKWNVSGYWVLTQSDGRTVEIKLVQGTDGTLGGSGDFVDLPRDGWPTNPSRDRSSPKGSPARSLTMVSAWRSIGLERQWAAMRRASIRRATSSMASEETY